MIPCAHCGLPAPRRADGAPAFCCVGCEAIYHAIHDGGFENFYQFQGMGQQQEPARGVDRRGAEFGYLDHADFLDSHSELMPDGSRRVQMHLEGVHCAGCVWLVEKMPAAVEGVADASLSLGRGHLEIVWDPDKQNLSQAARWLARFGYMPHPLRGERVEGAGKAERALLKRVGVSWSIAGNIMIMAVAAYGGLNVADDPALAGFMRWVSMILATISMVYGGGIFFRRAWASVRAPIPPGQGSRWTHLSMDVPIAVGLLVGWLHSAAATVSGQGDVWFDSIAVLIAALLTARWLQVRGRRFAGEATERLLSLLPATARRILADGSIEEIPADQLKIGDRVEIRTGDVAPADGVVERGRSTLHRAIVTGESRPEPVAPGQTIDAGVTNLGAVLTVQVLASGKETRVGKLMRWVEEGDRRRAPVVQLADKLGGIFVLVVLGAALLTGAVWGILAPEQAVAHVVALLVISCPCALGMATPLALTVGVGRAARQGIFIKHDDVLQSLAGATHILFDKTGTLTEGRMSVADLLGDQDAAIAAATLELQSSHPIARALVDWAHQNAAVWPPAELAEQVEEVAGAGILGLIKGREVAVGKLSWLLKRAETHQKRSYDDQKDIDWPQVEQDFARAGGSPVFVAIDGELRAALSMGDRVREDAPALLQKLSARGIKVGLLSGDHPELVAQCAASLGVDPALVQGGVTPEEKRDFLNEIRASDPDSVLVMVGDGVNDAIALQKADVGIAVFDGAQAALVAADIFVTREGVRPIGILLDGTHQVMRTIHRNLGGSAVYNALGIGAAALGVVTPLVAAIAMPFSSLFVITSSLMQRSFAKNEVPGTPQNAPPAAKIPPAPVPLKPVSGDAE